MPHSDPPYRRLLRLRFFGRGLEREIDDEIEGHIALRVEQLVAGGMSPEQARDEAIRRLGGLEEARRKLRASARDRDAALRRAGVWDALARDVALALRRARRAPGYTALVVLSLALGIGLTTAVFTVVDSVLLRPLPLTRPHELVALWSVTEQGGEFSSVSTENWLDWREGARGLAATGFYRERRLSVSVDGSARLVAGQEVGGDFFRALASPVVAGRTFDEEDAQAERAVAVVSEAFWRSDLGADPDLPLEVTLDGSLYHVVGVLADGTGLPARTDVWIPFAWVRRGAAGRNLINWQAIARLRPDRTLGAADAELDHIASAIREAAPEGLYSWGVGVRPLKDVVVGDISDHIGLLLGAVAFVLLITCANVAGLSVARILARSQDVAVRVAVGAGRSQVVRHVVVEHVLLGLVGGGLGVILAQVGTARLPARAAWLIPRAEGVSMNGTVLAFAVVVSVLAGVLAALAPALKAARVSSLGAAMRGVQALGRHSRAITVLVVAEVSLALLLLTGGGLLVRSYGALVGRELGFDPEGVVTVEAILNGPGYRESEGDAPRRAYWEELVGELRGVPGVTAVGVGNWIPTGSGGQSFIEVPGFDQAPSGAGYRVVSDDYFQALGVPVLAGRVFGSTDDLGTSRVTVINEAMAERYWPEQDPIGRTVRATSMEGYLQGGAPELTVIGIVGNVRHFGYDSEVADEMFTLYRQVPYWTQSMTVVARTTPGRADALAARAEQIARTKDPGIPVETSTLDERLGGLVRVRRFLMGLLTAFSALALVLAAVGVYGMLSFAVAQRTQEIGLRAALGATGAGLLGLVFMRAARVVAVGAALGMLVAFWLSRALEASLLEEVLVDVAPTDPAAYGLASSVLVLAAALAAFGPARRASKVDPLEALRSV